MDQDWWKSDPIANNAAPRRPLVINGPPREAPLQAPAPEALDRARLSQVPLQNDQTQVQIQSTRANMGQIPLQNQNMQTNIRTNLQQAEQSLRDDYKKDPNVMTFGVIVPQYAAALRAARVNNKAADLDLINAYAKILDPNSVVREGEVASAGNVGGVSDQVKGYFQSLQGQGRLTPEQRAEIVGQIRNRASSAADAYNQTRAYYSSLAQQHQFSPDSIVGPHAAAPFQQAEADYYGHPIKNGNGFTYPKGYQPPQAGSPTIAGEGDIGFNNHAEVASLPPQAIAAQQDVDEQIRAGKLRSYAQVASYVKTKYGFDVPNAGKESAAFDAAIAHHQPVNVGTAHYAPPDISDARGQPHPIADAVMSAIAQAPVSSQQIDAGIRGAADTLTMGGADEVSAAGDTLFRGGTMRENLARQRAIGGYDQQHNAPQRMAGQAAGAVLLPTGEINTVADLAKMGGKYGAAYGFGSAQGNIGDRIMGGAMGGAAGAGTSVALGGLGNVALRSLRGRPGVIPPLIDPATGSLNQPLESATAGQRVAAARQFGIDLPMDAAGDKTAAIIGKGFDISPASAGLMNDARRGTEGQVQNAADQVAGRYGIGRTMNDMGSAAQRGAQNWIGRFEDVSSKAYNAIPISPQAQASTSATTATLRQLTSTFQSNPALADEFKNARLGRYLGALESGKLSWQDLKDFRSQIGNEIGDQRFSDSPTRDQLRGLYGALSQDMQTTAAAQGPRALNAFNRANTLYAQGQQRIEGALTTILGDNNKNSPERAAATLQSIIKSNRGSANLAQLQQIRASMANGGEWDDVASSMIRLMGRPANSQGRDFNPQTFVQNYADMSEPARNLMFGDRGRADLRNALDQFVAVNQRLSKVNALRNTSQTAPNMAAHGTVGAMAGTMATMAINPLLGLKLAGTEALAAGANYGMAKLWTSPAFVRWATGYTKIAAGGNPAAVASQIGRLRTLAARDPTMREPALALERSLMSGGNGNNQPNGQ